MSSKLFENNPIVELNGFDGDGGFIVADVNVFDDGLMAPSRRYQYQCRGCVVNKAEEVLYEWQKKRG